MSVSVKSRRTVVVVLFVMIGLLNLNIFLSDRQAGEAWGEEPTPIAGRSFVRRSSEKRFMCRRVTGGASRP